MQFDITGENASEREWFSWRVAQWRENAMTALLNKKVDKSFEHGFERGYALALNQCATQVERLLKFGVAGLLPPERPGHPHDEPFETIELPERDPNCDTAIDRDARNERFTGEEIWVVTDPSPVSTRADIMFRVDGPGMIRQVLGGLSIKDRPRFFSCEDAAREAADAMLADRDARNADALHNRPEEL